MVQDFVRPQSSFAVEPVLALVLRETLASFWKKWWTHMVETKRAPCILRDPFEKHPWILWVFQGKTTQSDPEDSGVDFLLV